MTPVTTNKKHADLEPEIRAAAKYRVREDKAQTVRNRKAEVNGMQQ